MSKKDKRDVIVKKIYKTVLVWGMMLSIVIASVCRVPGSQEFYLMKGETMVIPCLAELWSDQSFSCVIGNPNVLMLDGSGRAVIAIGGGISNLFVHVNNPDIDVQYTFVVTEPEVVYEETIPEPEEYVPGPRRAENANTGENSGGHISGEDGGQAAGDSGAGAANNIGNDGAGEDSGQGRDSTGNGAGNGSVSVHETDSPAAGVGDESGGSGRNGEEVQDVTGGSSGDGGARDAAGESSGNGEGVGNEPDRQAADTTITMASQESAAPFWENPAEGGITFERVLVDDKFRERESEDTVSENGYTACVRIVSDGEVRPVFVSVGGREVRWKYFSGVLYVSTPISSCGAIRGGVFDCKGVMYYFSI